MPKTVILYNLKDGVKEEDYLKWVREYKAPLQLSLKSGKRFTMLRMSGGEKGDGQKGIEPQQVKPPYKYVVIMDVTSLEGWQKDTMSSKEFMETLAPIWFTKWVADFVALAGEEIYDRAKD
jgi:hypothetical protein